MFSLDFRPARFGLSLLLACSLLAPLWGCRTDASLHVWSPPVLKSAVGQQVVVAPLLGEPPLAERIQASMRSSTPRDAGRQLTLRTPGELQAAAHGSVLLASAMDLTVPESTSDLTLLALSRQAGADWLLMGEIMSQTRVPRERSPQAVDSSDRERLHLDGRLAVVWRLYDVAAARPVADRSIVVDIPTSMERHPDLAMLATDEVALLTTAAGREAWSLLTPSVQRREVQLAKPWLRAGSAAVREGNALAQAGHWPAAAERWNASYAEHSGQHAALHNLAIASAAGQDFVSARQLIRDALQQRDCQLYRQTAVWIELQQRDYHQAFGLPDPAQGWTLTH